jgi:CspA family cold shock protein
MAYGIVTWFDVVRGVGGIDPDDGTDEIPVHRAQIDGGGSQSLRAADRVSFTLIDGPCGPMATMVFAP